MNEAAKKLFDSLKPIADAAQAIAPGLNKIGPDISAEMSRLGTQGQMELASALFNGSAFVPYGPGQYTPAAEEPAKEQGQEQAQGQECEQPQLDRGGRGR